MDTIEYRENMRRRQQQLEDAVAEIVRANGCDLEPNDVFRRLPANVGGSYAECTKIYRRLTVGAESPAPVLYVLPPRPRQRPVRGMERLAAWVRAREGGDE